MPRAMDVDPFPELRSQMVAQIVAQTVFSCSRLGKAALDRRVLAALGSVPRHAFVPLELRPFAYADTPLPIGSGKTISQPFIVAVMTDLADVGPEHTVLEIGTGLGYQAAVLSRLARRVYSIELIDALAASAKQRLARAGCANVEVRVGNGLEGWPEHAPFDRIVVTAAPENIPAPLTEQLACGGKLVIPAGRPDAQQLLVIEKDAAGALAARAIFAVRFSVLEDTR